ncbi:MAG TPA: PAS domain S-box protein [Methanomicrobiales archaeon]|nr:PAS domain S-box protein [Methanomicrobiales archaeon]
MISVLHVDDEEELLGVTRLFLEKEGDFRVDGVRSAEAALERLARTRYDAIVSDYQMPGMDGIGLLKELRKAGNVTPFIILTGRGREHVAIEALNSGADFYLQKGSDPRLHFLELRNLILQAVTRRRATEALVESEEKYRNLAEASQDSIYIIDRDDRVAYLNASALAFLGKGKDEVVGGPRALLFPAETDGRLKRNLDAVFSGGKPIRVEDRISFRGRELWQDTSLIPLRGPGGMVTRVMGISRDITERKRVEDSLRESEEKYRNLVERAHEGIIVVQDDLVKFCNRRTAEMWGGECGEIVGRLYRDFVDPSEYPRLRENYERRMAGKEVPGRYDTRLVRKDGTSFPVDLDGGHLTYEGRPADLIMFRDITERKRTEAVVRESEEKYRALVERANDGIIVVQDGLVKFCNALAARIWGGGADEVIGQPYERFIDPSDLPRVREYYERRVAGEEVPRRYDARLVCRDGSRLSAELNAGTLSFEGRPADLILFRDMTERRMAEEAVKIANRKLNLLSSVTRHDILNQLMVVLGNLELAAESGSLPDVKGLVEHAARAAISMRHLIEFTKQYQDIGVHSPVWQDLGEVIALARSGAAPRGVTILLEIDPVRVFADPLLGRVFSNLIENALNHGEKVSTIRFSTRVTGSGLSILCEDDGVGVPPSEKERIFSPGKGTETGYGLFLVREILGITGATIREIGEEGKGALFLIGFPEAAYQVRRQVRR